MAAARKAALEAKLQQIQELLKGAPATPVETAFPCATGPSDQCLVKFSDREIKVVIGTSEHIQQPLVDQICHIVDAAYSKVGKHKRVDRYDAVDRLEMGDAGPQANRVLHLAFLGEVLVGCASSTFSPGWTPEGCGHWGLLAVHPDYQNSKVATALVIAAERRLATISAAVQIEYQYTEGEDFSTRLREWYEGKLGFTGDSHPLKPGQTVFRRCRKRIPKMEQEKGHYRRLQEIETWLETQIAALEPEESSESEETSEASAMHTGEQSAGGYPVRAA